MKNFKKQFGGKITSDLEAQYQNSPNWTDGSFQNLEETNMSFSFGDIPELLYKQFIDRTQREPKEPLAVQAFNKSKFFSEDQDSKFAWYGHSAVLMNLNGNTILIDPMLGNNTSPIAPIPTSRFSENTLALIDDLPPIDLMIISHDHYDHLDFDSIKKLKEKTKKYYVALGVKRHLVEWGVSADIITEFDWWDENIFQEIKITYTPTRHFSGRGLRDRTKSLWGGWVFEHGNEKIWFSGDGGFGRHFKEIGERFGSFDLAFMECGQYNEKWRLIHMFPEESVQAALIAKVKKAIPVHWSAFALAQHPWKEPAEQFHKHAAIKGLNAAFPRLGEVFTLESTPTQKWWEELI
ncbi:MAG: L-ascorbate metabolism protein UlaG (beta-lactamase superfamily) [Limisphaerales bacterium]|jgi:L-ascorbate metabolism protein UlaG (beta-lactamase superfamily)